MIRDRMAATSRRLKASFAPNTMAAVGFIAAFLPSG